MKTRTRDSLPSDKEKKPKSRKVVQSEKTKFRGTAEWQKFRKFMQSWDSNKDYITDRPLRKGHTLHHKDLNEKHYTDLSNPNNFISLNRKTHDFIHWLYKYYEEDTSIMDRIEEVMEDMKRINK